MEGIDGGWLTEVAAVTKAPREALLGVGTTAPAVGDAATQRTNYLLTYDLVQLAYVRNAKHDMVS